MIEGRTLESLKILRTLKWTNKKEPLLSSMDRRGGTMDYAVVLPKGEVPPTLIFGDSLQKITCPKQIECRFDTLKKTQTNEPYDKAPRVWHNLGKRKKIKI